MTLRPPTVTRPASLHISPDSAEGLLASSTAVASAVWPTANRAFYLPVCLAQPITIIRLFVANGTAVSGNVDVGVYLPDSNNLPGTKLISSGSTAQAGTSVCQYFDVADTGCPAGLIWLALACNNTTAQFQKHAPNLTTATAFGMLMQDTAFALPSSATPATLSGTPQYDPICGIVRYASP